MTYSASLFVIPTLAIAYLLMVYGMLLLLAKRTSGARQSEGEIR